MKPSYYAFINLVAYTTLLTFSLHAEVAMPSVDQELQSEVNMAISSTPVKRKSTYKKTVTTQSSSSSASSEGIQKLKPELTDEQEAERIRKNKAARAARLKNKQEKMDSAELDRLTRESKEVRSASYSGTGMDTSSPYGYTTTSNTISTRLTHIGREKSLVGINFYTFYSSAEILGTTNNSLNTQAAFTSSNIIPSSLANGAFATAPSFGLGLEFAKHAIFSNRRYGLGVAIGTTYEFQRELDRGYIDPISKKPILVDNPKMALAAPYMNLVGQYLSSYIFGGVNYSVPQMTNAGDEIYQGQIGFQVGGGMTINSWLALEATYRFVNMTVTPRNVDSLSQLYTTAADRKGLGVYEQENLSLNGFMINAKLRL